jgi:hypothetical protein
VLSVPWFWAPGMEAPTIRLAPERRNVFEIGYDAQGKRIDALYLPYTAIATGDPDFPVLVYVYEDRPQAAWTRNRQEGREEDLWVRIQLQGGEVRRSVAGVVYDAKARRWVRIAYKLPLPPRDIHAVPAGSAEDLAKLFGLPLWRRSELLTRFGLEEIFPETINPSTVKPIGTLIISPEGTEARR